MKPAEYRLIDLESNCANEYDAWRELLNSRIPESDRIAQRARRYAEYQSNRPARSKRLV